MTVNWQKLASIGICILLAMFFTFLLGKYLLSVFLPFIIAFLLASLTDSVSTPLSKKLKSRKRPLSAAVLLLVFLVLGTMIYFGITRLVKELKNFILKLGESGGSLHLRIENVKDRIMNLSSQISFLNSFDTNEHLSDISLKIDEVASAFISELVSKLGSFLSTAATELIRSLPSLLAFLLITVIASFYFAIDYDNVKEYVTAITPTSLKKRFPRIKERTKSLAVRYLKAYSVLMIITFFELLVGFLVLGVDYFFLLAVLIAFLDILPVFGVGTALIPWMIFEFFTYDFKMGFGLLVLWGFISIVRQFSEPKIVGETIGIHPVATVIGIYVGFKLFGLLGMFLSPAVLLGLKAYFSGRLVDRGLKK